MDDGMHVEESPPEQHEDLGNMDPDELAERKMLAHGLAQSQVLEPELSDSSSHSFMHRPSVMFASACDLLGHALDGQHLQAEVVQEKPRFAPGQDAECLRCETILLLPFAFWPAEDKEPPGAVSRMLLERTLHIEDGTEVPLWERTGLPKEVAELSVHFRQLLGFQGSDFSPVQRLKLTDEAREFLFTDGRLWADTKSGGFAGKQCEWLGVYLLIFPHGAILSVKVDWITGYDDEHFTLSDLRTWIYVAKFRAIKVGVTRGWTFEKKDALREESEVETAQEELGLKLYAALYGGSCISLGSVANWLVKLPAEKSSSIPRRISRFDYCHHHTCATMNTPPDSERLKEYLFHIRRAHGAKGGSMGQNSAWKPRGMTDHVLSIRANVLVGLSREGVFGVEWAVTTSRGMGQQRFMKLFMGVYAMLTTHCLSERVTLEKLSYMAALQSQNLPDPGTSQSRNLSEKDAIRRELMALATMLVRYRSSMASDDCGGRSEFREYFQNLRLVFNIAALKSELREELQDTLSIVESDWLEEKRNEKNLELLWKLKKETISKRKLDIQLRRKRVFDVLYSAFTALGLPFLLISGLWGMNNDDLPREVSWGYLMLGCGVVSIVLFFVIYVNFNRGRPELLALSREEQLLNAVRLERFAGSDIEIGPKQPPKVMKGFLATLFGRDETTVATSSRRWWRRALPVGGNGADNLENELDEYLEHAQDEMPSPPPSPTHADSGGGEGAGLSYLEPARRDYSFDIPRPVQSTATVKRSWLARLLPTGNSKPANATSAPAPVYSSSSAPIRPDSFGELELLPMDSSDRSDRYMGSTRGFSLDLQRPLPPDPPIAAAATTHESSFGRLPRFSLLRRPPTTLQEESTPNESSAVPRRSAVSLDLPRPAMPPPGKGSKKRK